MKSSRCLVIVMPLLKTCANNSRLESAGDFNDCYAKNDANNVSALSLCPRPWVGESCTWDGNGWVLGKLSHSASTLAMSTRRFGIILVKLHRSEQSAARCGRTSATVSVPLTTAGWAAAARGARRATGRAWSQGHRAPARWQQQGLETGALFLGKIGTCPGVSFNATLIISHTIPSHKDIHSQNVYNGYLFCYNYYFYFHM